MFRRRNKVAVYQVETADIQLKLIRAHIAAQASEMSNLRHEQGRLADRLGELVPALDRLGDRVAELGDQSTSPHTRNAWCGIHGHSIGPHLCPRLDQRLPAGAEDNCEA
jgi:hypothetical protein